MGVDTAAATAVVHSLGLTNSLFGLALFYTTFNLPFGVFGMRNTFLQIPWELSGQAAVDGVSATRTLVSVLRPLVVPGIAPRSCTPSCSPGPSSSAP